MKVTKWVGACAFFAGACVWAWRKKRKKLLMMLCGAIYLSWIWIFDRNASRLSNRKSTRLVAFLRPLANWLKNRYFPCVLVNENEREGGQKLKKDEKYLFVFSPHGIIGISVIVNFVLADPFASIPLDYRIVTISTNFFIPLIRDLALALGLADASRESIDFHLARKRSVGIVVGGAREAMDALPGRSDLILQKRLGFIEMALKRGAHIVPVFTFGENDLYAPIPWLNNRWTRYLQMKLKEKVGFFIPLVAGHYGSPLPKRKPLHTVIGRAMIVRRMERPSLSDVIHLHTRYLAELKALYHRYEHLYPQAKSELRVIDQLQFAHLEKWNDHIGDLDEPVSFEPDDFLLSKM